MEAKDLFPPSRKNEKANNNSEFADDDAELESALGDIWDIAIDNHLDPFPTHFEVAPATMINQIGAYGIPGRFSHWTFGRQYRQMKTQYDYGLSKIYELVINSNPSQAYLLENNPPIDNKFVMAHVLGHTDFFKNNRMFEPTRRDMPTAVALNASRIHEYEEENGPLAVERILDAALSLEEHIDPYNANRPSRDEELYRWRQRAIRRQGRPQYPVGEFDDMIDLEVSAPSTDRREKVVVQVPPEPDSDILGFIRNHAQHLEEWERDVIDIVRSESIYFYPQRRTKIMNEGWAAYWHKRIMREMGDKDLITPAENESWWQLHSSVVAPNPKQLNPYYLGMKVYEYLEDYYNGHLTDQENAWLEREGIPVQPNYEGELKDSPAAPMLREVMMHDNDQSFIRNHFNKIVSDRMGMYVYEDRATYNGEVHRFIKSNGWEDVRDQLVDMLDNSGTPRISVIDADYNMANELYLKHDFDGRMLDPEYIDKTFPHLYSLWRRPVQLATFDNKGGPLAYHYNGVKITKDLTH
ncbi:MAG: SpoVR family protein, partial [Candidatus Saccharimonadales bacterium]